MTLPLTQKYFPKTYHYLKSLTVKQPVKFIKKYALHGLKLVNPKTSKVENLIPNEVDTSGYPAVASVKQFNAKLDLDPQNECVITLGRKTPNAVMEDNDIYEPLADFVKAHYQIPKSVRKYTDTDALLANSLKNKSIKAIAIQDNAYKVYDLFMDNDSFYYSNAQLADMEMRIKNKDMKFVKSIDKSVQDKVHADSKRFTKYFKPILPTLMMSNVPYYRKVAKHGQLLFLVGTHVHA